VKAIHFQIHLTTILLLFLFLTIAHVEAHEQSHDQPPEESAKHMQAMMALKDEIPNEYRVMERTPIIPDKASLQAGEDLYRQFCAACHGEEGDGKGPAAAAMQTPPASFLDKEHSAVYGPGEKFWIIANGTGKTGMPGFPQLEPTDRWNLVNYIFDLQK